MNHGPRFNLSDWALKHRSFVWFLLIVSMLAGAISYANLGREEGPELTIKVMVISAALPGASIDETLNQVTKRIEKKLEELDELDFTRSVTMPGQAIVYIELDQTIRGKHVPEVWKRVREMMSDAIRRNSRRNSRASSSTTISATCSAISMPSRRTEHPARIARPRGRYPRSGAGAAAGGQGRIAGRTGRGNHLEFSPSRLAALGLNGEEVVATLANRALSRPRA